MSPIFRTLFTLAVAGWLVLPPGWCCVLLGPMWTIAQPAEAVAAAEPVASCCHKTHAANGCHDERGLPASDHPAHGSGESCLCLPAAEQLAPAPPSVSAPDAPVGFIAILPPPLTIDPLGFDSVAESALVLPTLSASSRQALLCVWRC